MSKATTFTEMFSNAAPAEIEDAKRAEVEMLNKDLEFWLRKRRELEIKEQEFRHEIDSAIALVDKTIHDIDAVLESIYWGNK
jgi:hypothetical protein